MKANNSRLAVALVTVLFSSNLWAQSADSAIQSESGIVPDKTRVNIQVRTHEEVLRYFREEVAKDFDPTRKTVHRYPYELGLFQVAKETPRKLIRLFELQRNGFLAGDYEINWKIWEPRPEFSAFLLYAALGLEPRVRVRNYIGEWVLFPSLSNALQADEVEYLTNVVSIPDDISDEITAEYRTRLGIAEGSSRDRALKDKIYWGLLRAVTLQELRSLRTYKAAGLRSWEKQALEETLFVTLEFNRFLQETEVRMKVAEEDLPGFATEDRRALIKKIEAEMGADQPFRLRILPNQRIEASMVLSLADLLGQPTRLAGGGYREDSDPDKAEGVWGSILALVSDPRLKQNAIRGAAYSKHIDSQLRRFFEGLQQSGVQRRPELAAALETLRPLVAEGNTNRDQIIAAYRTIASGQRARYWIRRFAWLPAAFKTWKPQPEIIAAQNSVLSAMSAQAAERIRAGSQRIIGRLAIVSVAVILAADAVDAGQEAIRFDRPKEVGRKLSLLAFDAGLAYGIWKLGLGVPGLFLAGAQLGTFAVRHTIWADCPTVGDVSDVVTELCGDAVAHVARNSVREVEEQLAKKKGRSRYASVMFVRDDSPEVISFDQQSFDTMSREVRPSPFAMNDLVRSFADQYLKWTFETLQTVGTIDFDSFGAQVSGDFGCGQFVKECSKRETFVARLEHDVSTFLNSSGGLANSVDITLLRDQENDPRRQLAKVTIRMIYELENCAKFDPIMQDVVENESCTPTAEELDLATELKSLVKLLAVDLE